MTFEELNIIPSILNALEGENYIHPTPIQEQAIPAVLEGRDVLACAQTGTGKTAAFAVPTLQLLSSKPNKTHTTRSLILTPTRELALQIDEDFKTYGKQLDLITHVIFGGVSQSKQVKPFKRGVDILVATPGRLLDFINQGIVDLSHVEILILDEADRMLDMGFIHDVKKIIAKVTKKKQTLLFSATMPKEITSMVDTLLQNPKKISVTPVSSTVDSVKQYVYFVDKNNKAKLLYDTLTSKQMTSVLVFTRTKHGANHVVKDLLKKNIHAEAIHGNKSQSARQNALQHFKDGETQVLVATDIAARGIDIDELPFVINYDLPEVSETYVHRIGRTGRAGFEGSAYAFCSIDEMPLLKSIEKLIKKKIEVLRDHDYPMMVHEPTKQDKKQKTSPAKPKKKNTRTFSNTRSNTFKSPIKKSNARGR